MPAGQPDQPDLTSARASVLAFVAGSPMSARPPTVEAAAPLRPLPPAIEAKLAAHEGGTAIEAAGARPGRGLRQVARVLVRDPLRLSGAERRAVRAASSWRSNQAWTGPLAACPERGLVIAAANAAERITRTAIWRSGRLDDQRLRVDLGAELDQIDDQARRIAAARHEHGAVQAGTAPTVDAAWEATLNRVAALTAYADQLDGYERRRVEAMTRQGDPVRDSELMTGAVRDEMALDEIVALTFYLSADLDGGGGLDL